MWKTLTSGDKVSIGNTLRYKSNSNSLLPPDKTYSVVKVDQHYFEVIQKPDQEQHSEEPSRKAIRYTDIGYNVKLERWSDDI